MWQPQLPYLRVSSWATHRHPSQRPPSIYLGTSSGQKQKLFSPKQRSSAPHTSHLLLLRSDASPLLIKTIHVHRNPPQRAEIPNPASRILNIPESTQKHPTLRYPALFPQSLPVPRSNSALHRHLSQFANPSAKTRKPTHPYLPTQISSHPTEVPSSSHRLS